MDTMKLIGQKIKGETQLIVGKAEVATGQNDKGNVNKLRGSANVLEAEMKIK